VKRTYRQRSKEDAYDYRFFPDPDLPPVVVDNGLLGYLATTLPELPNAMRSRLVKQYARPNHGAKL
jgi:aspartyl-tRNA(Asn)/glutamyl-tRNA(Gln) amidotransferase subunit B